MTRHQPHREPSRPQRPPKDRRAAPRVPLNLPVELPPAEPTRVGPGRVRTLPLAATYEEWVRVAHPGVVRVKPRPIRPARPRRSDEAALERPTLGKGPAR